MNDPAKRRLALMAVAVLAVAAAVFLVTRSLLSDDGDALPSAPAPGEARDGPPIKLPTGTDIPRAPAEGRPERGAPEPAPEDTPEATPEPSQDPPVGPPPPPPPPPPEDPPDDPPPPPEG